MLYDRKIKYLNYMEGDVRVSGGGFVKLEAREKTLRVDLSVTGLYHTDTFVKDVMLCGRERETVCGRIEIMAGRGRYRQQWQNLEDIGGTGIGYEDLCGLRIPLGAGREISCRWQPGDENVNASDRKVTTGADEEPRVEEPAREDVSGELSKADHMPAEQSVRKATFLEKAERQTGSGAAEKKAAEESKPDMEEAGETYRRPVMLMEDKWSQLWAIYPHIRPFQDEREYLSISPSDFVLFPAVSYRMVNNSFLLHGYYNYRHLILARAEGKGEQCYYIGVPGNFYEREKQVAIMFGFESFECAEEPAQPGDFGYYMMRTSV